MNIRVAETQNEGICPHASGEKMLYQEDENKFIFISQWLNINKIAIILELNK